MDKKAFFEKNGYVLIPNVYSQTEIEYARQLFDSAFQSELWKKSNFSSPYIINDIYRYFPELVPIIFNQKYVEALREILGNEIIFLPECAVHHNRYIDWHKDTTEQELGKIKSHQTEQFFLIQSATYFQIDTNLTVVPGSHLKPDRFIKWYRKDVFSRIINKISKLFGHSIFHEIENMDKKMEIKHCLGDLLLFDVRIDHKSTKSKNFIGEKYAIFNTFGNANRFTEDYLEFMKQRPEPYYQFLSKSTFPENLYQKANELGLEIWS
jgi:hypothetical protein